MNLLQVLECLYNIKVQFHTHLGRDDAGDTGDAGGVVTICCDVCLSRSFAFSFL